MCRFFVPKVMYRPVYMWFFCPKKILTDMIKYGIFTIVVITTERLKDIFKIRIILALFL
jgi:hypothetical protein